MISYFVKFHVKRIANHKSLPIPKNLENTIRDRIPWELLGSVKLWFLWSMDTGSHTLNASATIPGLIILNSEWAAELALNDNPEVDQAIKMTIGHELTHMNKDFCFVEFGTCDKKFVNWINEIHADFGAVQIAFQGNRKDGILAIRYKKDRKGRKDKSTYSHPSWAQREEYLNDFNFDEVLIRRIASDLGCKNERLINHLIQYYKEIYLQ